MNVHGTPPHDLPRRPRLKQRTGRCYELAGAAALDRHDWMLVHGTGRGPAGSRIGHAWLERDGWVYDPTLDVCMQLPQYIQRFAAERLNSWRGREVAEEVLRHGHWGPWDSAE